MNEYSENLYEKVKQYIPESQWMEIVMNRPNKSVYAQGDYFVLKTLLFGSSLDISRQLLSELKKRYIPYSVQMDTKTEIEFLPLHLKIDMSNINELDSFTSKYKVYDGVICFQGVPLPVIIEYAKRNFIFFESGNTHREDKGPTEMDRELY